MGVRDENRAAVEAEILRVGREHLGRYGAAAISLRAVARDLGMVSSGIYRYVDGRDELLTRLIIHAYTALAAEVAAAHDRVDAVDLAGRWDAIGRAVRRWALEFPYDYALIYGSPVPDYAAPAERTSGPGTAVLALVTRLLDDIARSSAGPPVDASAGEGATAAVGDLLADDFFAGTAIDAVLLARGLSAWTLLIGAVSSEVFGQLGDLGDPEALFEWHLAQARGLVLPD
ncbi:TetR/AcrR family transcriptional regulator [Intrasporangium mesophilum]